MSIVSARLDIVSQNIDEVSGRQLPSFSVTDLLTNALVDKCWADQRRRNVHHGQRPQHRYQSLHKEPDDWVNRYRTKVSTAPAETAITWTERFSVLSSKANSIIRKPIVLMLVSLDPIIKPCHYRTGR